ncbi:hypothetical protein [Phytoactinopolyspora limicola]|uniref:hypothetical protein n=1 Tax=Phytoactinopolyspora limicola TaxID=2715536 RepID=UPI001A9C8723|nr:hypothetical protein [Phytoactinopolyspora limicola]
MAATSHAALVVDGAGTPVGADTGCVHDVAWYSQALGSALIPRLAHTGRSLTDSLAEAISDVAAQHGPDCDLGHPGSPSATVTTVRERDGWLEYLVLADSPLVLDLSTGIDVICDNRVDLFHQPEPAAMRDHPAGSAEHTAALREYVQAWRQHHNREGGFWSASTTPDAAAHALTGSFPLTDVRAAALLSDGASRLADRFGLLTWRQLLDVLDNDGPAALIQSTRAAEDSDPNGHRWPRGKSHDDATAIHCRIDPS